MTPAMAATTARLRYAGDRRPVAVKQTTQEEPGAHPEHVEGDGQAGGTTERRVDGHCDHGGASNGDGGAPVAVMDKMTKKQGIKNHGIKAELKASLERTRTDRSALATATRTPRWCCRPRGRRAASDVPR